MTISSATRKKIKSFNQLISYSIIGIISNTFGYLSYLLITYFGGTPKSTMTLMYIMVATASFLSNRTLTFFHHGSLIGSGIRFTIAHLLGYTLNLTILFVMVDIFEYAHKYIQAGAIFIVDAFLFLALKFFVFKQSR